jgi:hypothetical protein
MNSIRIETELMQVETGLIQTESDGIGKWLNTNLSRGFIMIIVETNK